MAHFYRTLLLIISPLMGLFSLTPGPKQNYCPVVFVNNTGVSPENIYFLAHGENQQGIPSFIVPDTTTGICTFQQPLPTWNNTTQVPPAFPSSVSASVRLSDLPQATGGSIPPNAYLIYMPVNSSSRAYFSINSPLFLATALQNNPNVMGIDDPSVSSLTDPNFYTLYQDFELGLVLSQFTSATTLFMNLSWVDYFCLPMQLSVYDFVTGQQIVNSNLGILPSGINPSLTRENVINQMMTSLNTISSSWGSLGIKYYNNPYTDQGTPPTYLRILAAKNSVSFGTSNATFVGALSPQTYFPTNYFTNPSAGPVSGQTYYQTVYNYYLSHEFYFQIVPADVPIGSGTVICKMTSVPSSANLQMKFECTTADVPSPPPENGTTTYFVNLVDVTPDQFLSGATWPFTVPAMQTNDVNYTNEISKALSALFTIGRLPYNCASGNVICPSSTPTPCNSMTPCAFMNRNQGYASLQYFQNPFNYSNGPWNNVYCRLLHQMMVSKGEVPSNSTLGLGYAYDYDDLLNMAGLLSCGIQNIYGNPVSTTTGSPYSEPYVLITLGSLSGTPIPDISQDSYQYDVVIGSAGNGTTVEFSYYLTQGGSQHTQQASSTDNLYLGKIYVDANHPFQVTFSYEDPSMNFIYSSTFNINLLRQSVTPLTSGVASYTATDVQYQGSFVFSTTPPSPPLPSTGTSTPSFFLTYNSSPPRWPG